MSFGKMKTQIDLITLEPIKDEQGFATTGETIVSSVRAYKEDRNGNESWKNRAVFSKASALFRFRAIPSLTVTTNMIIACESGRYNIISVENVKGRGMYLEVLCEKVEVSG
ncbi:head-tail adaptor protein [Acetobacterium sp. KB-1]|jgi:head-tail adaptor|uniref:head-tail adaptor protein n=1 Tax=Acetobacterium sp. KB-1 TaxID=2184575 RepID=UPI000DBEBB21|nr:head-tail adaptor protein [Acetobacterium sp. KB-1]AWW25951.1 head-tail adaptor protein [Acetobacterium sp. KB-1]